MARDPGEREEFNLDLEWPQDSMIRPLVPATPTSGTAAGTDLGDLGPAPIEPVDPSDEDDEEQVTRPEVEVSSADRQRQAFVETLNPSMAELVADFEALASTTSTFANLVDSQLRGYLEEVELMETVSSGYLRRYRDGHLRALTRLRNLVGDSPAWAQWLADSIKEMATAVDDAVDAVRDVGQETRAAVSRSSESVKHMGDAMRWVGEQLLSNLAELHKVVVPERVEGEPSIEMPALLETDAAMRRALTRLSERGAAELAARNGAHRQLGDRDGADVSIDRLLTAHAHLETEVSRLADELRGLGGSGEVIEAVERLADDLRESGSDGVRAEMARLAEEMQALRRRLGLRARTPVTLEEDQIDAIAQAVAATIAGGGRSSGSSPSGDARRRPLEAPGRATRKSKRS